MQYATENIIPVARTWWKISGTFFFEDVMDREDDHLKKAQRFAMFTSNQGGEICTCPSRALVRKYCGQVLRKTIEHLNALRQVIPLILKHDWCTSFRKNNRKKSTLY